MTALTALFRRPHPG